MYVYQYMYTVLITTLFSSAIKKTAYIQIYY